MTDAVEPAAIAPDEPQVPGAAPGKLIPEAARRALMEAAERRAAIDLMAAAARGLAEDGGPAGPEPTRYGDWERKGVAIDFS